MASTYYAWSNFPRGVDETGNPMKPIAFGSEVTQADIGVDDEDWKILVDQGAVRQHPVPKAITGNNYGDSPNRYYRDLLSNAADAEAVGPGINSDEFQELRAAGLTGDEETTGTGDVLEEKSLDPLGGIKV